MRHNVTTPGGFFVGLGGIAAFCVVSSLVYLAVKSPGRNEALRPQQTALGLVPAPDATPADANKKKAETDELLKAAGQRYNGGEKPDINRLAELRGVIRYREAQKSLTTATAALAAPSSVEGKTVIAAAMDQVVQEIQAKKPAPSQVALAEFAPADPKAAPALPNYTGGGVRTVNFIDPTKPVAAPAAAPAAPAAPAQAPATPAAPAVPNTPAPASASPAPTPAPTPAPAPAPAPPAAVPAKPNAQVGTSAAEIAAAPNRPPLLNWSETK